MLPSSLQLAVGITKQGKRYIAHSPALDISTSGKTEKDAQKRFETLVQLFFEELAEMGTTKEVLTELGWKKVRNHFTPPSVSQKSLKIRIPSFA